jgi:NAD(P)-dependent dehydrogenase (short-subunit alcohol dehydrogenase family)
MSKVILITGANRGIGLELARLYAAQECEVIAVCRESSDEIEELADQVLSGLDLTDDQATDVILQLLDVTLGEHGKIDVLINNAGVFKNETLQDMDLDTIRLQFEVNAITPLKITQALMPYLKEGSKVANITSRMGSVEDNGSGAYYGYRASKAALNAFGKSLAIDLKPKGVSVALLHPGFVQTRMVGFNGDISPLQAATGIRDRIEELTLQNSGGFWHSNGDVLPW